MLVGGVGSRPPKGDEPLNPECPREWRQVKGGCGDSVPCQGAGGAPSNSIPGESCVPLKDSMLVLSSPRVLQPTGDLGLGVNLGYWLCPRNRMGKASRNMLIALPCQAHCQGLLALNLPDSRIFRYGRGMCPNWEMVTAGRTHLQEKK